MTKVDILDMKRLYVKCLVIEMYFVLLWVCIVDNDGRRKADKVWKERLMETCLERKAESSWELLVCGKKGRLRLKTLMVMVRKADGEWRP
jgi:hypothetical protein